MLAIHGSRDALPGANAHTNAYRRATRPDLDMRPVFPELNTFNGIDVLTGLVRPPTYGGQGLSEQRWI